MKRGATRPTQDPVQWRVRNSELGFNRLHVRLGSMFWMVFVTHTVLRFVQLGGVGGGEG